MSNCIEYIADGVGLLDPDRYTVHDDDIERCEYCGKPAWDDGLCFSCLRELEDQRYEDE